MRDLGIPRDKARRAVVFTSQEAVLRFFAAEGTLERVLAAAAAFVIIPLVAYLYGTVPRLWLKMIRME